MARDRYKIFDFASTTSNFESEDDVPDVFGWANLKTGGENMRRGYLELTLLNKMAELSLRLNFILVFIGKFFTSSSSNACCKKGYQL